MSSYFPLVVPTFEATVPVSFARNWEVFVRPRGGAEGDTVPVYVAGEDGAAEISQPCFTDDKTGLIGDGETFGWIKGSDLPVDLWGRPKGTEADWQVLPEGDQAVVAGGIAAAGKADLTEPGGKLVESQLPDSVVTSSSDVIEGLPSPTGKGLELVLIGTSAAPVLDSINFDGRPL